MKMMAIFKRNKGVSRKWIDCNMNNTKSKHVIKKKLVVDGNVWDEGQTVEDINGD